MPIIRDLRAAGRRGHGRALALLAASRPASAALTIAGAAYLMWLGLHALWQARRATPDAAAEAGPPSRWRSYRAAC